MSLEARYRRLLRAYPASWRAVHEDDLVATYLDTARPGQDRPSFMDALDALWFGARARLRDESSRVARGLGVAGFVALTVMSALSAAWLRVVETGTADLTLPGTENTLPQSRAAGVWLLWIAAGAAYPFLARRGWPRAITVAALLAGVVLVPTMTFKDIDMELQPEFLVPVTLLGLVAVFAAPVRRRALRALPAAAAIASAAAAPLLPWTETGRYTTTASPMNWLGLAGAAAVVVALLVAIGLRRSTAAWAALPFTPAVLTWLPFTKSRLVRSEYGFEVFTYGLMALGALVLLVSGVLTARRLARRLSKGLSA